MKNNLTKEFKLSTRKMKIIIKFNCILTYINTLIKLRIYLLLTILISLTVQVVEFIKSK